MWLYYGNNVCDYSIGPWVVSRGSPGSPKLVEPTALGSHRYWSNSTTSMLVCQHVSDSFDPSPGMLAVLGLLI